MTSMDSIPIFYTRLNPKMKCNVSIVIRYGFIYTIFWCCCCFCISQSMIIISLTIAVNFWYWFIKCIYTGLMLILQFFTNEESLMAHRHIYHDGASASKNSNDKAYECDVCMKVFNKHSSWWKHKKCHTGERAYKCYICEKTFTQQANLHRVCWFNSYLLIIWRFVFIYRYLSHSHAAHVRALGREAPWLYAMWQAIFAGG